MIQGSFITDNELISALSSSFVSSSGVLDSRNGLDARKHIYECNLIPVRGKGSEDYETWMNFAKKLAVQTISRNLPLLFRKKVLHPMRLGIFTLISSSKFNIFNMKYHSER